ncbi:MAG: rhomboid family intramembrane serine protease [Polyangia bacterium]
MGPRATFALWPFTPAVKRIVIACVAIWIVQVITRHWLHSNFFVEHLALSPQGVISGEVWQLLTWMWLHSDQELFHILMNCLFLWMFGGTLESAWGSRAFLRFYLICGLGSGVVVLLFGLLFGAELPTLGSSGAIFGLVAAWAISFPNRLVYLFGVIPIKGKHFALIPIVFALADFLLRGGGVSHSAHLGGMAIGALLVTGYWRPSKLAGRLRYWWLRRKLRVYEGRRGRDDDDRRGGPPDGGYWH